jgi:drug/metabolite transporter (DMT)-like permease
VSALATGLVLAVAASVALNTGYLLQHRGSSGTPAITPLRPIATLRSLLASRAWLAGLVLGTLGWAMHVGALARAPLSLVQAFVAGGLALAVPIGRRLFGQVLSAGELVGVVVMALSLAGLAAGITAHGAGGDFDALRLGAFLGLLGAAALVLALLPPGSARPHALALAGGALYGAADVAIKALTSVGHRHGLGHALLSPWLAVALLATIGAFFCFQRGLQSGRALPVIALMTAATNALSILAGFLVFGDPLGRTPGLALLHVVSLATVVVAAGLLSGSQALDEARSRAPAVSYDRAPETARG